VGYPTVEESMAKMAEYDARIDSKKRLTLRGASFDYYHVQEYPDGRIILEPRQLVAPHEMSKKTLAMIDKSVANLKKGKVSKPVDLSAFKGR
jgi:hypothetical protein